MEGWPGDACPSVPAVSQPPAATQQLLLGPSPQPKTALGAFVPCVLPLSLSPRPCSSSAAQGDDSLSPRLGPAALVPTARADKEALEGLGTAWKGPGQAQGHGRDVAENQGTVARPGMGTVSLGMGTAAWPGMRTVSLRMGTRVWLAGNGDRSVTSDGNNGMAGDRDQGVPEDNRELGQWPDEGEGCINGERDQGVVLPRVTGAPRLLPGSGRTGSGRTAALGRRGPWGDEDRGMGTGA